MVRIALFNSLPTHFSIPKHAAVTLMVVLLMLRPGAEDGALHAQTTALQASLNTATRCGGAYGYSVGAPTNSGNTWGGGASGETDWKYITWSATTGATGHHGNPVDSFHFATDPDGPGSVSCGAGTGFVKEVPNVRQMRTQAVLDIDSASCFKLYVKAYNADNNNLWEVTYDTSKIYIEQCPHDFPYVIQAFSFMSDAIQHIGNSGTLRSQYLDWLKSVLYLNTTDPEYFCACVEAIAGELPAPKTYWSDTGYNYPLSVYAWLLKNTNCDTKSIQNLYYSGRADQHQAWENSGRAYTLDTTLLTMQQLGLDTLFAKHFLYQQGVKPQGIISSLVAAPNPTGSGTTLTFGMSQDAYVRVEVFDVLGSPLTRPLPQAGEEKYFSQGNQSIPIDLSTLPAGTYYARITTSYGEAQMVKIIRK